MKIKYQLRKKMFVRTKKETKTLMSNVEFSLFPRLTDRNVRPGHRPRPGGNGNGTWPGGVRGARQDPTAEISPSPTVPPTFHILQVSPGHTQTPNRPTHPPPIPPAAAAKPFFPADDGRRVGEDGRGHPPRAPRAPAPAPRGTSVSLPPSFTNLPSRHLPDPSVPVFCPPALADQRAPARPPRPATRGSPHRPRRPPPDPRLPETRALLAHISSSFSPRLCFFT
jgi:hypothetical protein